MSMFPIHARKQTVAGQGPIQGPDPSLFLQQAAPSADPYFPITWTYR